RLNRAPILHASCGEQQTCGKQRKRKNIRTALHRASPIRLRTSRARAPEMQHGQPVAAPLRADTDQAASTRSSERCSSTGTDFDVGVLQTSPVLASGISGLVSG